MAIVRYELAGREERLPGFRTSLEPLRQVVRAYLDRLVDRHGGLARAAAGDPL